MLVGDRCDRPVASICGITRKLNGARSESNVSPEIITCSLAVATCATTGRQPVLRKLCCCACHPNQCMLHRRRGMPAENDKTPRILAIVKAWGSSSRAVESDNRRCPTEGRIDAICDIPLPVPASRVTFLVHSGCPRNTSHHVMQRPRPEQRTPCS